MVGNKRRRISIYIETNHTFLNFVETDPEMEMCSLLPCSYTTAIFYKIF